MKDVVGLELAAFDDTGDWGRGQHAHPLAEPIPLRGDIRPALHQAIDGLAAGLAEMAGRVVDALSVCVAALRGQPADVAAVIAGDAEINSLHNRIRHDVLHVLTTQAPLARDLRRVVASLLVDEELERMGDHCVSIATQRDRLAVAPAEAREALAVMASDCMDQVRDIAECLASRDCARARHIAARDEIIDRAYHDLIDCILDGDGLPGAGAVVLTAHKLERIGDRVTNIAEHIVFAVEGELVELG
jgi:phosphate transport system protein